MLNNNLHLVLKFNYLFSIFKLSSFLLICNIFFFNKAHLNLILLLSQIFNIPYIIISRKLFNGVFTTKFNNKKLGNKFIVFYTKKFYILYNFYKIVFLKNYLNINKILKSFYFKIYDNKIYLKNNEIFFNKFSQCLFQQRVFIQLYLIKNYFNIHNIYYMCLMILIHFYKNLFLILSY